MPEGMILRSEGFASNLADPADVLTLERFCAEGGIGYGRVADPIPVDVFCRYGQWFQERAVPNLDPRKVIRLRPAPGGFELTLEDGEVLGARRVVVATGIHGQAFVPPELRELPPGRVIHASEQAAPADAPAAGTMVLGAGQSALEAAALIHESDRPVRLVARAKSVVWLSRPGGAERSLADKFRNPESGLGEGRGQWFYSNFPRAFHRMPPRWRLDKAFSVLGPLGAWWLRPRIEDKVELRMERRLVAVDPDADRLRISLAGPDGTEEIVAGQILAATGFKPQLGGLGFLDDDALSRLGTLGGAPRLDRNFQSTVPGLHFVGYLAAPSFGPLMRFVFGARFAARTVTKHLATDISG